MDKYSTTFTFIIPCYNSEELIIKGLQSIFAIDYPKENFKVIVVDDNSTDRTTEVIKSANLNNVKLIELKKNHGPAYARNIGVRYAKTNYVIFLDTQTIVEKNILKQYSQAAREYPNTVFCGTVDYFGKKNLNTEIIERGKIIYMRQGSDSKLLWAATNNLCVPKSIYQKFSFNTKFTIAAFEDIEYCFRIRDEGFIIRYVQKSIAYHKSFDSFKETVSRMFRYGKGTSIFIKVQPKKSQFAWEFLGRIIILISFIFAFVIAFIFNKWQFLLWPIFHYLFSTYYLFYGNYAKARTREKGIFFVFLTSIYENYLIWVYQLGVIYGNIKNRQSPFLNINPIYISEGGHGGLGFIWFIDDIIIAIFFYALIS